jgi:hypothetical protein
MSLLQEFGQNVLHNMFKPLLLFFYMGFLIPVLGVSFEFPYVVYQGLTMYLLIAIGWHGGEELASLNIDSLQEAVGFMVLGFFTNFVVGVAAYQLLRRCTNLRKIDAATVAGYYGSDSAGTFVTCVGVLKAASIAYAAYMPVMLAVMEIPGCLVALFLVSRLRASGMDAQGNAPDEAGYNPHAGPLAPESHESDVVREAEMSLEKIEGEPVLAGSGQKAKSIFSKELLHEVFLNPGIYLLFGGIAVGFISRKQGESVVELDDELFVKLFHGVLCLFLLEMGITASRRLKDLKTAGWQFIAFGLLAPNAFAGLGICVAHLYAHAINAEFATGTYVLFAVLCGAASYIAVPAVQRLAIPEASPTLPLAASLGLTFSYNVTIGIPVYILIAQLIQRWWPVAERTIEAALR